MPIAPHIGSLDEETVCEGTLNDWVTDLAECPAKVECPPKTINNPLGLGEELNTTTREAFTGIQRGVDIMTDILAYKKYNQANKLRILLH